MTLKKKVALGAVALLLAWPLMRGARSAWYEYNNFRLPRTAPQRPRDADQLGLRDVQFASADHGTMRGWYIPSRTGAAVVVAGGSGCDRTVMLRHARLLVGAGLGVLLFDWPGCGESEGAIGFGRHEVEAVRSAVDFVARQPDVQAGRIGALGFSQGSWAALLAGEQDPRLAAFVLEGVFDDPRSQIMAEYESGGLAAGWGAVVGATVGGLERSPEHALARIAAIAPRPVVFVTGSRDVSVPTRLTRALFDAAPQPRELWVIDSATHGGYLTADPKYGARMRDFLVRALRSTPPGPPAAR